MIIKILLIFCFVYQFNSQIDSLIDSTQTQTITIETQTSETQTWGNQTWGNQTWGNHRFSYSLPYSDIQRQFYVNEKFLISIQSQFTSFTISESTLNCSFYNYNQENTLLGTGKT